MRDRDRRRRSRPALAPLEARALCDGSADLGLGVPPLAWIAPFEAGDAPPPAGVGPGVVDWAAVPDRPETPPTPLYFPPGALD